eukprot:5224898-Amphidinium_carterae.1
MLTARLNKVAQWSAGRSQKQAKCSQDAKSDGASRDVKVKRSCHTKGTGTVASFCPVLQRFPMAPPQH